MSTERPVRVRFAPSPTGPLHIGGVRTALYNYLLARKHGGTMILRIEDTDQNRFVPGAEQYIVESLKWVGIEFDEGVEQGGPHAPYRQSERKPMYAQYAYDMIDKGLAYYAFDTEEDLDQMRKRLQASKMQPAYDSVSRMSMKNSLTLPADEVKIIGRRGNIYHIHVVFCAQIKESLQTSRAVFCALSLEPMRQKHHETAHAAPFVFCRRDKLVDHDLRTIVEIAKLGFPNR